MDWEVGGGEGSQINLLNLAHDAPNNRPTSRAARKERFSNISKWGAGVYV